MKIYSLKIEFSNGIAPVYEAHTWSKVEEIIKATQELTPSHLSFTWEVSGNAQGTDDAEEVAYGDRQAEIRLGLI